MELKEEGELEENLLGEVKKRNLPLSLGVQSQGALPDMEESPNPKHPTGAKNHPQEDEPKLETIMPTLKSWTLGQLRPRLPSSTPSKCTLTNRTPKPTPSLQKGPKLEILLEIKI